MKRIMILGVSSGVGKSTFAKKLGEILQVDVYHLDALYWRPGWVEAPLEEFADSQRSIVEKEKWIIEGNYSNTYDIRAAKADMIIYLELPRFVCLYRVVKRWLTHLGKVRPDVGAGCKEKLDWEFIKFIYTTYSPRKKKMAERFHKWINQGDNKKLVRLSSKASIQQFLDQLSNN